MEVRIGDTGLLDDLPKLIKVDKEPYIISRNENNQPILLDATCPHQGHTVQVEDNECLECKGHGWTFDPSTGKSNKPPGKCLNRYQIIQRGQNMYVNMDNPDTKIEFNINESQKSKPMISLLSHATLAISYNGFNFLTDPWLDGPAFLGAWTQYPPPTCDISKIVEKTDAIWITHEHSDHLHPRTLSHFPTSTTIYVPEMRYRRLSERLTELGFQNIHTLSEDRPYRIAEGVEAACFSSDNSFNDSILAVNCGGFRILNLNDAGVNYNVKNKIPSFELVASSFTCGAGGYPLTWSHIDTERKLSIMESRNKGLLEHCRDVSQLFDADYFLPFAKFFAHLQPEHKKYSRMLEQNRPRDVVDYLSDTDITVLDLLPGESWDGSTGEIERREHREKFFDEEFKWTYLDEAYHSHTPIVTESFNLTHGELSSYFNSLADSELAKEVGDLAFTLSLSGDERTIHCLIQFEDGTITYHPTSEPVGFDSVNAEHHIIIECSGKLVQYVVRNNLSWDEITIGYWCKSKRRPDEYNQAFWRLLHAPWEAQEDCMKVSSYDIDSPLVEIAMADLVEKEGIEDILIEYGMNCAGCPAGLGEDITEAAKIHGLGENKARDLISDIEARI